MFGQVCGSWGPQSPFPVSGSQEEGEFIFLSFLDYGQFLRVQGLW